MPKDFLKKKGNILLFSVLFIAIIITGGTIGLLMYINTNSSQEPLDDEIPDDIPDQIPVSYYETPGIANVSEDQIIKIGVIGPMSDMYGLHIWQGAWLAAYEINAGGGIEINGETYYIGLTNNDTHEASSAYVASQGTDAVNQLITVKGAKYLIGGSATHSEPLLGYMERVMELKTIFMGTGAADDVITWGDVSVASGDKSERINSSNPISASHLKYKYFFRTGPHISTYKNLDIINALINTVGMSQLQVATGGTLGFGAAGRSALIHAIMYNLSIAPEYFNFARIGNNSSCLEKIAIFREDMSWSEDLAREIGVFIDLFNSATTLPGVKDDPIPYTDIDLSWWNISATADIMTYDSLWDIVITDEIQMVIPIISYDSSISMMKSYASKQPKTLVMGLDFKAQESEFMDATEGGCDYEAFASAPPNLDMTVAKHTHAFYDAFLNNFSHTPISVSAHAYDSVMLLRWAIDKMQSFETSDIIIALESITASNPLQNITVSSEKFAFTETHDPVPGPGFFETAFGQWQDGEQVPIPTGNYTPEACNGNFLHLPPWGIYGITT